MTGRFFELKEIKSKSDIPPLVRKLDFQLYDNIFLLDSKIRNKILSFPPAASNDPIMRPEDVERIYGSTIPFYLISDCQNDAIYALAYNPKKWMVASGRTSCVYLAQNIKTGEYLIAKTYYKSNKSPHKISPDKSYPIFANNIDVLKSLGHYRNHFSIEEHKFSNIFPKTDKPFNIILLEKLHNGPSIQDILEKLEKNDNMDVFEKVLIILKVFKYAFEALDTFNKKFIHNDPHI
ncbi:MAG: hypothetical protein JO131_00235, partial [Gammaproteobacteria bacterium]|nr:hypothetical protein [Gammaproteobacteria bacterium]